MFVLSFPSNCQSGRHVPDFNYLWAMASFCRLCYSRGFIFLDGRSFRKAFKTRITCRQMRCVTSNVLTFTSIVLLTPKLCELGSSNAYFPRDEVLGYVLGFLRSIPCTQGTTKPNLALGIPVTLCQRKLSCSLTCWFDEWNSNSSLCNANKNSGWSGYVTMTVADLDGAVVYVTTLLVATNLV
jgi:hypothetical protein